MLRHVVLASLVTLAVAPPGAASAQTVLAPALAGTRVDVVATGEVVRVPDMARVSAGVVTQAPTATAAIEQNARQMARVRAALKRAGIADRDIQTSSISLQPDYRYAENQPPQLTGYRASNEVTVRFRDIAETGRILDALVSEGANQINGPMLAIDKQEEALDEARQSALAQARRRAELYARALGKRVTRILSISEAGASGPVYPIVGRAAGLRDSTQMTKIDPGEQTLSVALSVSFELE